jgi:two-component system, LytTR family, sensor kinase
MSRRQLIYFHIFIWLFAAFANLPFSGIRNGIAPQQVVTYLIAFLYLMVAFYLFYLYIAPLFLNKKNLTGFLVTSFFVVLIMPFFGYLLLFLTRALFEGSFNNFFRGYSLKMHMSGFYPVLTAAVFGSFFRVIINWFETMNQKAELDKQKLSVELDLLKSKLNPHFLFNTLNNIDSLIQSDQEKASFALIKLSEMMRYLTYETKSEVVALDREIAYISNMIELYRLRLKSKDAISFVFNGEKEIMIAPALFVPLIENAFKFASFTQGNPAVKICLTNENGILILCITNYYDQANEGNRTEHSGYGISNLKRRLELIYPDNHELTIEKGDHQFVVKLIINTDGDQMRRDR